MSFEPLAKRLFDKARKMISAGVLNKELYKGLLCCLFFPNPMDYWSPESAEDEMTVHRFTNYTNLIQALQQCKGDIAKSAMVVEIVHRWVERKKTKHRQTEGEFIDQAPAKDIESLMEACDGAMGLWDVAGVDPTVDLQQMDDSAFNAFNLMISGGDFIKVLSMLGKGMNSARQAQQETLRRSESPTHEIETGGDIDKVIPSELAMVGVEKAQFIKSLVEGDLLQDSVGVEKIRDGGDIVILCDESNSMSGDRICWAKAFSAAMIYTASAANRKVMYYPFGGGILSKKPIPYEQVLSKFYAQMATDIPESMVEFMDLFKNATYEKQGLDFVIITDDMSPGFGCRPDVKAQFNQLRKDFNIRSLGVHMVNRHRSSGKALKEITDKVCVINSDHSIDTNIKKLEETLEWMMK